MDLHGRRRGFAVAALLAALALIASACGASPRVEREVLGRDRNGVANGEQASALGGADSGQAADVGGSATAAGAAGSTGGGASGGGGAASAGARRAGTTGGGGAGTA